MAKKILPLKEVSIEKIFVCGENATYEIPIYQRNYAWEKDEISALIQDVYDAYKKDPSKFYYIGTLVSFYKGDQVYEIIDGQQRLTTIRLILGVLGVLPRNQLTYRARRKADLTIKHIPLFDTEEADAGIVNGYKYAKGAIEEIIPTDEMMRFTEFFKSNVHIIHYNVPKDVDLNHYFEIMNSRGEQLEKHEIIKAKLIDEIGRDNPNADRDRRCLNQIWEACSEMSVYVQQNFVYSGAFGPLLNDFIMSDFDEIANKEETTEQTDNKTFVSLEEILESVYDNISGDNPNEEGERKDSFLPIIDFSNFLLVVLKITMMDRPDFVPVNFNLDDKELLNEFGRNKVDVKRFAYNLLKARFLLDNYIVHHSREEDTIDNNPWKLQVWQKDNSSRHGYPKNLSNDFDIQEELVHLLSMFEVSFTARQRKNYLFYCLFYLMKNGRDVTRYTEFVEDLADRYFNLVYLDEVKLNAINTPLPGSFDETLLKDRSFANAEIPLRSKNQFYDIYGDGEKASNGVPLFVFNYIDYKIWLLYAEALKGEKSKADSSYRKDFFDKIGCSDFGLDVFRQFYFSRTRRSLEHYYPQATATGEGGTLDQNQINCLGNYAMIGSEANSSGSNWSPKTKLDHYLDSSGKISQISVASLKFMIMMQMCKDEQEWNFEMIRKHQEKMLSLIMP